MTPAEIADEAVEAWLAGWRVDGHDERLVAFVREACERAAREAAEERAWKR
jgi:hypothetical protein